MRKNSFELIRNVKNAIFLITLFLCFIVLIIPLFHITSLVFFHGLNGLDYNFFFSLPQAIGEEKSGMGNAIFGTLILIVTSSLIGIPLGVGSGIYLAFFNKNVKYGNFARFCITVMTSTPSILIGLFIFSTIVIPFKQFSALAGALALAMIMAPILAKSTEEILRLTPISLFEAGLAIGLTQKQVIFSIVLRTSAKAILSAIVLSIARISGETAPLLFTAFNSRYWPTSLYEPIASLPIQVYQYATSPFAQWHSLAYTGACLLMLMMTTINLVIRIFLKDNF